MKNFLVYRVKILWAQMEQAATFHGMNVQRKRTLQAKEAEATRAAKA
jgi:hypothetical protein